MRKSWLALGTMVVLFGVVLVGVVLWFARREGPSGAAALAPGERARPAPLESGVDPPPPSSSGMPAERERVAAGAPREAPAAAGRAEPAPSATGKLRVEGTVVVLDDAGLEHAGLDGELEVLLWKDGTAPHTRVSVQGGAWSVEAQPGALLGVATLTLGGREGWLADDPYASFPVDEGPIALRARWHRRTLLHVVDDASGAELRGVKVLSGLEWQNDDAGHPGEGLGAEWIVDGSSPLTLEPKGFQALTKDTALLVHAPGYAWGRIQVDLTGGGERELRLGPEARLELFLTGAPPHARAKLRLFDEGAGPPYLELDPKARRRIELDGLAPGSYEARLEVGDWWDRPMVQAEGRVELRAGEQASLTLDIAPPPELARARLAGLVVVPPEWELENAHLAIELDGTALDGKGRQSLRLDALPKVESEPHARRFDAGLVQLGTYELTLSAVEYTIRVELPATGREDVRLEVPPPAAVSIEVIDEQTGQPAEIDHLNWHCARTGGGGLNTVQRDADSGRFDFRAPQASVVVSTWGDTHQPLSETLEIGPGANTFTLRAKPGCSVTLRLFDGDTPVPWEGHWYPEDDAFEGPGRLLGMSFGSGERALRLSAPGRYVFELPEFPGFEPPAPVEVDARAGETIEVPVPLTRRR